MRETTLVLEGHHRTLFDELDIVSAVSGGSRPLVVIGATDMSQGSRFEFLQDPFDLLCSDLGSLKLATAVAASAAVPIALSPITLRNHAAPCPHAGRVGLYGQLGNRQRAQPTRQTISYLDKDQRP